MNTYIMNSLKQIKNTLTSCNSIPYEKIDPIMGELEMMKMEIEQHISNMGQTDEYKELISSAENAVEKLTEILDIIQCLNDANISDSECKNLISEISDLIDEICY